MAEATTPAKKTDAPAPDLGKADADKKDGLTKDGKTGLASSSGGTAAAKAGAQGPHVVLRLLIGLAGLSLLVGFFLPWLVEPAAVEGGVAIEHHGYNLAMGQYFDTPGKELLWVLPALGVVLSAMAFMGFRYAGQVAIATAVAIIGFALYVLLQIFVQRTALGLWIVAGGTFVILLLGVIAWLVESRRKATTKSETKSTKSTPSASPLG